MDPTARLRDFRWSLHAERSTMALPTIRNTGQPAVVTAATTLTSEVAADPSLLDD
jgi:hypothetical protein